MEPLQRQRQRAIVSYGLIAFTVKNDQIKFLLYKRRDTFEYIDFIRGAWNTKDEALFMVSSMKEKERQRLLNHTFDELWDDLWVDHTIRIYKDGYERSKEKFEIIQPMIKELCNNICVDISIESLWGFPKGKKKYRTENVKYCAIREFCEETKINSAHVVIVDGLDSCGEKFTGTNGKIYMSHYFVAQLPIEFMPSHSPTPQCIRNDTLSEEASKIGWFTFENACAKLNSRREKILTEVYTKILNMITI
jgi:hypothetical protein